MFVQAVRSASLPQPPAGASPFVAKPDLPGDHCLRLTGQAGALLRGKITDTDMPVCLR